MQFGRYTWAESVRLARQSIQEIQNEWQNIKLNLSWVTNRTLTTDILTVSLTKRCNLNCSYCWDHDQRKKVPEMSTEDIKRLLRSAKELGVRSFNPFGGEPFIRKDALAIIEYAFSLKFMVTITTNGTLLTQEKLRQLVESVPHDGHLIVLVSLDGATAEENDFIRETGSFDKTTATIRHLNFLRHELGRRVDIIVNTVVSRNNFRSMVRQIELTQNLGADQVHFLTPIVNGGIVAKNMSERALFVNPIEFEELDQEIDRVLLVRKQSKKQIVLNNPSSLENFKAFYRRQYQHHKNLIDSAKTPEKVVFASQT